MINYSIAVRAVNTNLLEINQAKARIKAAKEAGVEPQESDVTLANTPLVTKAYAVAQYSDVMTIEKFAKHISDHGCVYSHADISAILYMAVDCMRENLLDGKKIRLGDLGDFSVSLVSKGADSADKFNAGAHITGINVTWDCGQEFKNLIADAEFNLVASRSAQAAVLKSIKEGSNVVDLSKPVTEGGDDPNGGGTPTNPSNPSGGDGGNTQGGSQNQTRQYTISLQSANPEQGTVAGGGTYTEGSRINISATPKSGFVFDKWSDGVTTANRQVTVNSNLTLTASFKEQTQSGGSGDDEGGVGEY